VLAQSGTMMALVEELAGRRVTATARSASPGRGRGPPPSRTSSPKSPPLPTSPRHPPPTQEGLALMAAISSTISDDRGATRAPGRREAPAVGQPAHGVTGRTISDDWGEAGNLGRLPGSPLRSGSRGHSNSQARGEGRALAAAISNTILGDRGELYGGGNTAAAGRRVSEQWTADVTTAHQSLGRASALRSTSRGYDAPLSGTARGPVARLVPAERTGSVATAEAASILDAILRKPERSNIGGGSGRASGWWWRADAPPPSYKAVPISAATAGSPVPRSLSPVPRSPLEALVHGSPPLEPFRESHGSPPPPSLAQELAEGWPEPLSGRRSVLTGFRASRLAPSRINYAAAHRTSSPLRSPHRIVTAPYHRDVGRRLAGSPGRTGHLGRTGSKGAGGSPGRTGSSQSASVVGRRDNLVGGWAAKVDRRLDELQTNVSTWTPQSSSAADGRTSPGRGHHTLGPQPWREEKQSPPPRELEFHRPPSPAAGIGTGLQPSPTNARLLLQNANNLLRPTSSQQLLAEARTASAGSVALHQRAVALANRRLKSNVAPPPSSGVASSFDTVDTDHDGVISRAEYNAALPSATGLGSVSDAFRNGN
jgi:hypothetical protein